MRLSKEEERCGAESNSIGTQRKLLQSYAAVHFTDYALMEFSDDGYTGTNFDRPGIQALLEMVKELKIDCIIVKDFSRFARDYVALGSYLEQIFPFMGVRFISVNDDYDSSDYPGSLADIDVNFRNLLYDLYSKDLSQKVRSSLAARKEKGVYISANSPFGYEKNPKDRHGLLIETDEAKVVRKIFSLALAGYSSVQIAGLLNEEGVKTPIEFKIEKGKTKRVPKGGRFLWSSSTICSILRNEVYIGNIVQRKTTKEFAGGKNRLNPRERWLVCHHHEPIIEKELFDRVQKGRRGGRSPKAHAPHPLVGKLVCGCCKRNLCRRDGNYPYFYCNYRFSNAKEQCVERVDAGFLEQYLLSAIHEKMRADGEFDRRREALIGELNEKLKAQRAKQQMLLSRAEKLKCQRLENYQNYALGRTNAFQSDSEALRAAEKELERLNDCIARLEAEGAGMECESGFAVLTKELVDRYIEKAEVCDKQHIEIFWK